MRYTRLGSSGIKISVVALGSWLTFGHRVDVDGTREILDFAFDAGINFVDTADVYAMGRCEETLGQALVGRPRKDYVLATKAFFPTGDGPNDCGLSRKHLRESLAASLERLKTPYVDLYQCHRYDPDVSIEELVRTMNDFIRAGLIFHWGVSLWSAEQIMEAVACARSLGLKGPVSNQPVYNMLQRGIEEDVLPVCRTLGIGQIVYSPLAQGLLTGKYSRGNTPDDSRAADAGSNQFIQNHMTEENFEKIEGIRDIARSTGQSMAKLALAWCLREPGVNAVIVGARSVQQLAENVEASEVELPSDVVARIDRALRSSSCGRDGE